MQLRFDDRLGESMRLIIALYANREFLHQKSVIGFQVGKICLSCTMLLRRRNTLTERFNEIPEASKYALGKHATRKLMAATWHWQRNCLYSAYMPLWSQIRWWLEKSFLRQDIKNRQSRTINVQEVAYQTCIRKSLDLQSQLNFSRSGKSEWSQTSEIVPFRPGSVAAIKCPNGEILQYKTAEKVYWNAA